MDSLPTKYAKTAQLLQRKKEELEQVFEEARSLESENVTLMSQNRELKSRNVELESATRSMSFEFAALEAQTRKLQTKLQFYIDQEASGHGTSKPRPQDAAKLSQLNSEIVEWRKKYSTLEETQRKSDEAHGRMQQQIDSATVDLRDLREQLAASNAAKDRAEHRASKAESHAREVTEQLDNALHQKADYLRTNDALELIEAEALTGLRQEIAALTDENHRLLDQLEDERQHTTTLRHEADRFDELLQKQRYLSEGQLRIARDEVVALNTQNESLLGEVKRLMVERDTLRRARANDVPPPAPGPLTKPLPVQGPVPVATRTCGTMTIDVFAPSVPVTLDTPRSPPSMSTPVTAAIEELQAALHVASTTKARLTAAVDHLEVTNENLHAEVEGLRSLIREKEASVMLLEEKNRLLSAEASRSAHAVSTPLERLVHRSPSQGATSYNALIAELEEVDHSVGRTLILGTRAYHVAEEINRALIEQSESHSSCSDTDDGRRRPSTTNIKGSHTIVPVVPCNKFREPVVNHIMEQIGGLKHIIKRVWSTLKAQTRRAESIPIHQPKKTNVPQSSPHIIDR